jgi:hypothetical protein
MKYNTLRFYHPGSDELVCVAVQPCNEGEPWMFRQLRPYRSPDTEYVFSL